VGCMESPFFLLGSTRTPLDENEISQWGGATWYEPRMCVEYRVSMQWVTEVRAVFPLGGPRGYPNWVIPESVDGTRIGPEPVDFGRASEIGVQKGYGMLSSGEGGRCYRCTPCH
jgi:hypothetical protein